MVPFLVHASTALVGMSKNAFRWYAKEKAWMTITLELPPETEMSLLAQAEARGLTLDAYLQTVIATKRQPRNL
jgi:hypothetical protein